MQINVTIRTVHGTVSGRVEASSKNKAIKGALVAMGVSLWADDYRLIDRKDYSRAVSRVLSSDPAWFNVEASVAR